MRYYIYFDNGDMSPTGVTNKTELLNEMWWEYRSQTEPKHRDFERWELYKEGRNGLKFVCGADFGTMKEKFGI